jgi:hypothetical protein
MPTRSTAEAPRKITIKQNRGRMDLYKGNVNYISTKHSRRKKNERNEEWYAQECREIIEIKREAMLKYLQRQEEKNYI